MTRVSASGRFADAVVAAVPLLGLALLLLTATPATAADDAEGFLGDWSVTTRMGDGEMSATLELWRDDDGALQGVYRARGRDMKLSAIEIDGDRLRFDREIPGGDVVQFDGTLDGDTLEGAWTGGFGELPCTATRGAAAALDPDAVEDQHDRPIVEENGRTLLWAHEDEAGNTEWFDMTGSTIDPRRFQFGIGKDTIASIDEPEYVAIDDPRLAARGVTLDTRVLGVEIDGIARAYPVSVMSRHEVVNTEYGGKSYAVLW